MKPRVAEMNEGPEAAKRFRKLMTPNGKTGSLHAKCIVVDGEHVFVSSANFTEAAQQRNIEVGLLIQSHVVGERVCRFFETLLDHHYFLRTI